MPPKKITKQHALNIEGEMTIINATSIKEQLLQALKAEKTISVDLSSVTEFDSAGLQLMVASKQMADTNQRKLIFMRPSEVVTELLSLSRMTALVEA